MARKQPDEPMYLEDLAGSVSKPEPESSSLMDSIVVSPPRAAVPGEVYVVNLTPGTKDITLTDGRNLRVGPRTKNGAHNRSEIIPRKLLPPYVKRLEAQGFLRIVDAAAKGGN